MVYVLSFVPHRLFHPRADFLYESERILEPIGGFVVASAGIFLTLGLRVVTLNFLADGSAVSLDSLAIGSVGVGFLVFLPFSLVVFPVTMSSTGGASLPIYGSTDEGASCIGLPLKLSSRGVTYVS